MQRLAIQVRHGVFFTGAHLLGILGILLMASHSFACNAWTLGTQLAIDWGPACFRQSKTRFVHDMGKHVYAVHVIASKIRNGAYGNCRTLVDAECHERY